MSVMFAVYKPAGVVLVAVAAKVSELSTELTGPVELNIGCPYVVVTLAGEEVASMP